MSAIDISVTLRLAPELAELLGGLLQEMRALRNLASRIGWNQLAAAEARAAARPTPEEPAGSAKTQAGTAGKINAIPASPTDGASAPSAKTQATTEKRGRWRTPERAAILRRDWPADVANAEIRRRLQALPGPEVGTTTQIGIWAAKLGVKRSPNGPKMGGGIGTRAPEQGTAAPPPVPASAPAPPVVAKLPPPPPAPAPPVAAKLPAPSDNGKIYVAPGALKAWAAAHDVAFDGDMRPIEALARRLALPSVVCDHTLAGA